MFCPGVGTAIGAVVGGILGFWGGAAAGGAAGYGAGKALDSMMGKYKCEKCGKVFEHVV